MTYAGTMQTKGTRVIPMDQGTRFSCASLFEPQKYPDMGDDAVRRGGMDAAGRWT